MLVVEAREIGPGRLLAVEPDVLDRGRAGPEAIFVNRSFLGLLHCVRKLAMYLAQTLTDVGAAHRSVFEYSDQSSEARDQSAINLHSNQSISKRSSRMLCLFGG